MLITNIDEVVQAWKEGKPQPEVEKLVKWAFGEEGPDLWQMLFAKPLDTLPLQMDIQLIESFFPQQQPSWLLPHGDGLASSPLFVYGVPPFGPSPQV